MNLDSSPPTGQLPIAVGHPAGTVGLAQGTALYIASVLGTGILVLPALAVRAAGPASVVAVLAVLALSVPLAGTFAALAARHPDPGGVAHYVRLTLGPTAARMAGYWFFFGVSVGAPVVATLGAQYIGALFGVPRWVVIVLAVVMLVPPFVSNLFGVKLSGPVQLVLTAALVAIVVVVVTLAAPAVSADNFEPFLPHGWLGVGAAVSLFVWAFAGWEAVTHIAGEFKNPRRTIPLATAIAIVVVGAAYLALQLITVGVMGGEAAASETPLLDLVRASGVGFGPVAVAIIAGVVVLGVLNMYLGAFAKLGAALARDGDLPAFLGGGAATGGIPRRALAATGVLVLCYFAALVLTDLELAPFILIHTSCMVAVYAVGMVAALKLLDRFSAGWWMAVIACVLVAGLLVLAGVHLLIPVGLALAAMTVTAVRRRRMRAAAAGR